MDNLSITLDELHVAAGQPITAALLAGRVVATVVSRESGRHITIQLKCRAKQAGRWTPVSYEEATHVFIDVPNPGEWADKVGTFYPAGDRTGQFWRDRDADPARAWAALYVLQACAGRAVSPQAELLAGVNCLRCGRELTDPESITRNVGPECWGKITASHHQRKHAPDRTSEPLTASEPLGRPDTHPTPPEPASGPQESPGEFVRRPGQRLTDLLPILAGA